MEFNELLGKKLSFSIYNPSALGGNVVNSELLAVTDYSLVSNFTGESPSNLHNIVAPFLPSGVAQTEKDYQWLIVKAPNGSLRSIGVAWIDGVITEDASVTIKVTIRGKTTSTIPQLRAILVTNGFTDIDITT